MADETPWNDQIPTAGLGDGEAYIVTGIEQMRPINAPAGPQPGERAGILLRGADRGQLKARLDAGERLALLGPTPERTYDHRRAVADALIVGLR